MPYTSGTTGHPKGCMHTHRSVMYTPRSRGVLVQARNAGQRRAGGAAAVPRDRHAGQHERRRSTAAPPSCCCRAGTATPRRSCVQRYRVTGWHSITTMVVDFLANPQPRATTTCRACARMGGGGAAMPEGDRADAGAEAAASRTSRATACPRPSPPPTSTRRTAPRSSAWASRSSTSTRGSSIPATLQELPPGEIGEIVVHGPQVFQGYWNQPEATARRFVEIDGKRFLRTGDLGAVDEDGYFFLVDRLKRMINAAGLQGVAGRGRGDAVPAPGDPGGVRHRRQGCAPRRDREGRGRAEARASRARSTEQQIIDWSHDNMAAYKVPRIVRVRRRAAQVGHRQDDVARAAGSRECPSGLSAALRGRVSMELRP